jgi:hypothetical protein
MFKISVDGSHHLGITSKADDLDFNVPHSQIIDEIHPAAHMHDSLLDDRGKMEHVTAGGGVGSRKAKLHGWPLVRGNLTQIVAGEQRVGEMEVEKPHISDVVKRVMAAPITPTSPPLKRTLPEGWMEPIG